MDTLSIQAAATSLKAAVDLSKSLLDMKTTADVQAKVIEIQRALLDAQAAALAATSAQFELLEANRELEAQLKERDDWQSVKARYTLVSPWQGPAQAYALRREAADGDAPHFLCPNCFHKALRRILHPQKDSKGWLLMVCPECRASMATDYRSIGVPQYAEDVPKA